MHHGSPVHMNDPLMAEAHAEHRDRGVFDHLGADAEVARPLRSSRSRGDDDIVELVEHAYFELGPVIGHERRRAPVHLGKEVKEVERKRIGIVDEQSPDHARLLIHNDLAPQRIQTSVRRGSEAGILVFDRHVQLVASLTIAPNEIGGRPCSQP